MSCIIFFLQLSCTTSDLYQQNLDPAVNPDQIQNWSWILCWLYMQPSMQDWAMWLDGELCGVVGNNNMCWPAWSPSDPHPQICERQGKQQTAHSHRRVWTHSRDWDKSGPEKSRAAWLVPDHGVSPVIVYLIAIRCRSPSSPLPRD